MYTILSFVFSAIALPIVGVILGHLALRRATPPERTLAVVATSVAWGFTALLLLPVSLLFFSTVGTFLLALLTVWAS